MENTSSTAAELGKVLKEAKVKNFNGSSRLYDDGKVVHTSFDALPSVTTFDDGGSQHFINVDGYVVPIRNFALDESTGKVKGTKFEIRIRTAKVSKKDKAPNGTPWEVIAGETKQAVAIPVG